MSHPAASRTVGAGPRPGSRRRPWLLLVGFNLLVAALAGAVLFEALVSSRKAHEDRAADAAANIAHGTAQTITAKLLGLDTLLRATRLAVQHEGGAGAPAAALQRVLATHRALLPDAQTLLVATASGEVIGDEAAKPANLAGLDYFRQAQSSSDDMLIVSEPLQRRIGEGWGLVLARSLRQPDGRFDGLVMVVLSTRYFDEVFAGVEIGEHGAVTVRTATRRLVARRTEPAGAAAPVGDSVVSAALAAALERSPQQGSFLARTALDGIERINSYQRVDNAPLIVLAGLATGGFLKPWREEAAIVTSLYAVLLVVLCTASALMWRAWQRARESAQRAERDADRYQALMRTASDGIHVLDLQGRVVDLSDSFAQMLGHAPDDMLGRHVSDWDTRYTPESREEQLARLQAGLRELYESRFRRADGSLLDVELSAVGIRIDGQLLQYCSARDVTERRRAAQAVVELAREQALRSQAESHAHELNALVEERGVMLDVLAHEVRQPLNNASAALQGAASSMGRAGEAPQPLTRAQTVLEKVMASIDNTLAVAALLARSGPIERADTDIDTLVAMVIADMPADERPRILIERATPIRTASMDLSLMRLALRNVLANALKYAPRETPVTVRIADGDDPLELCIDVIDQGPGIPPGDIERMFERGTRGGHRGGPAGLGLGLYIVRRVMELHGGHATTCPQEHGFAMRLVLVENFVEAAG